MRIVVPYTFEVINSIIYEYNAFFYPFQLVFIILSLFVVYTIWMDKEKNTQVIVGVLAFFWFWVGAVYQINYYNSINWIGVYIGMVFILQSLLFLWFGVVRKEIKFKKSQPLLIAAFILIVGYPLWQLYSDTNIFEISVVGMLPNITVVFSLILISMQKQKKVWSIFIIPIIWSIFSLYWNYLLWIN